jgi:hexosaminidase
MKRNTIIILLLGTTLTAFFANAAAPSIIPAPRKIEARDGVFKLTAKTRICTDSASRQTGEYLAGRLRISTGFPFKVVSGKPAGDDIQVTTQSASTNLGAEGYELTVTPRGAVIRAPEQAGAFYGAQTLLQLLPPQVFATNKVGGVAWEMPCVDIQDQPRFQWRGLMLDVSRHFYTKDEVKRFLDEMALHKLNTFHWHLVDDQGWRIEIKKYPLLTKVGAWRNGIGFGLDPKASTAYGKDGRYGGFYTQADIREVVAYASRLHITIVPEIEMPGHSTAALAAYPQFSCTGKAQTTDVGAGVHAAVYCAGKDGTFGFLQDVLSEVMPLFPGKYIHIGGDEVRKDNWKKCDQCQARMKQEGLKSEEELQSYFIRRIEKFINARHRTLIGWSEILQGGLAQNATVMDWIGGGAEAASEGHDVVMSPASPVDYSYFDHYQSRDRAKEPRAIGGFLPLETVYSFEPIPAKLDPTLQHHILGAQGNLWTEYIPSFKHLEYMAYPRACAMAEVTWSPKAARNWDDFARRLTTHLQRLEDFGTNYRPLTPIAK